MNCSDELSYTICTLDWGLAVAILTFINLLVYVAELVYWAYQVSVGSEDVSSAPVSVWSHPVSLQSSVIS